MEQTDDTHVEYLLTLQFLHVTRYKLISMDSQLRCPDQQTEGH